MAASPDVLAEGVRARRTAIDNDLEVLRVRLQAADPRKHIDLSRWAATAVPVAAGLSAMWMWARRRRSIRSLDQLLLYDLASLYASEHQALLGLRRMADRATDRELVHEVEHHILETNDQIERLERVFRAAKARPTMGSSEAVQAVLHDGYRLLKQRSPSAVRDACIIETAQRIEHIEIANYGTARTFADLLGHTQACQLLQQTLEEKKLADQRLTRLAERFVNPRAIRGRPSKR